MEIAMTFTAPLILMMAIEYAAHRWYMHHPRGPNFAEHFIAHHGRGENDDEKIHVYWRTIFTVWAAGSAGLFWLAPWSPLVYAVLFIWWRFAWSECHLIAHDLGGRPRLAFVLCPWYRTVVRRHLDHHRRPSRNFGAIFWWTDYLAGTAV